MESRGLDIRIINKFSQDGLLNDDAFIAASRILRPISNWFSWARQMLFIFGNTLVLAGIIFFFAYNWSKMGRFFKFGLIESGIIVCIIGSYLQGRTQLTGKVLLLCASVMVGVLLAVYGQIYQTGADTFELFIGWAILIFGWVVISEFDALWLLWLIILNTGVILYWAQVGSPAYSISYEYLCLAVAVINGLALALCEAAMLRGVKWLRERWLCNILLATFLVALLIPTINQIVDSESAKVVTVFIACTWIIAIVGGYICYRYKLRDMVSLSLIIWNVCIVILTMVARALFDSSNFNDSGPYLFFSLIILGLVSGAAFWLRTIAAIMAEEVEEMNGIKEWRNFCNEQQYSHD
ncbi:DUF2157 domain-containing protein [Candidatus Desantisbacteria bacterium]|nr:DUF2157 domain-containing protein [Candidatus Desantisbacteria bacterium]